MLTENYPTYTTIDRLFYEIEIFTKIQEGKYDIGLTNVNLWTPYERNEKVNKHCSINWVRRVVHLSSAPFFFSNSTSYCSNLARNVIHIFDMICIVLIKLNLPID